MICIYCLRQAEHGAQCRDCFWYVERLLTSGLRADRTYGWRLVELAGAYHTRRVRQNRVAQRAA